MYTTFIQKFGGLRVAERLSIPAGKRNADYWVELGEVDLLLELKQISKYDASRTIDLYFTELIRRGKVKNIERTTTGKVQISPDSLSPTAWRRFYEKFRPAVENGLKEAAVQLRDTAELVAGPRRKIGGVVLLNSGDYSLSTDLLFRLCEHKIRSEWKFGRFRSIDFVSCHTVDLQSAKIHPLHSRHIVKSNADENLVGSVLYLQENWLSFVGETFGFEAKIVPSTYQEAQNLDLQTPFVGKIQKVED